MLTLRSLNVFFFFRIGQSTEFCGFLSISGSFEVIYDRESKQNLDF